MSALVTNLLDMARIESGQVNLRLEWQPFEEVVGAALNAMQQMLKNHTVIVEIPQTPPLVRFDSVLIERVLVNLLENASKYTPAGTSIWLSATTDQSNLRVSIADNGPGLPVGGKRRCFKNSHGVKRNHRRREWAWDSRYAARSSMLITVKLAQATVRAAALSLPLRCHWANRLRRSKSSRVTQYCTTPDSARSPDATVCARSAADHRCRGYHRDSDPLHRIASRHNAANQSSILSSCGYRTRLARHSTCVCSLTPWITHVNRIAPGK
jgi:hypothetical protein